MARAGTEEFLLKLHSDAGNTWVDAFLALLDRRLECESTGICRDGADQGVQRRATCVGVSDRSRRELLEFRRIIRENLGSRTASTCPRPANLLAVRPLGF